MSAKSEKLNNIKINIKCIVVSNSLRMTVEDLSREYRQIEGRYLSVDEFGYSNLLDFLKRECTDIIRLQSAGTSYVICPIITKEIENLNSLIEKQKLPANVLSRNYRRNTSNVAVGKRSSIISNKSNTAAFKNATLMNNECTNVAMSAKSEKLNNIKINIKCIVVSNSLRMTVEDLSREYRQIEGRYLSVDEFGYSNLLDFLKRECTDIIRLQSAGTSYVICPIITKEIENLNSLIEKQKLPANVLSRNYRRNTSNVAVGKRSSIISNKSNTAAFKNATLMNNECTNVKENNITSQNVPQKNYKLVELKNELHQNLKMLIKDHRELWLSQLNDAYYKKFRRHLEYQKLGYGNIVALCRSMPHVFNIQRPEDYGAMKLYDRDLNLQRDFQRAPEKVDIPETSTLVSLEAKIFGLNALPGISLDPSLCPEECIDNEFQIRRASSPSVNSKILVWISEVVDPSHFWFHIVADEHSLALEKLMNSMDVLYKSSESYKMVRAQMKTGTHCAVPFEGLYHRAEIIANVDLEVVKVRYIDYGTILNVFCKDVRLLLKTFCELPVQAMRGRLSGVSPVHKWWSSVARRRFFGLVNGIPLAAKVSSTHDNNISCLGLMNTSSGSKDAIIAKVLYFEGLANLDSSTDKYWTYDPSLCPEECIDNEFQIRRASSPSVNSKILVWISEVVDPSHFWFHIVADEHSLALEKLMNSMDVLYKSSESYKMVRAQMKTGTHCAVPFEGLYYRAEIIANVDLEVVKVRYIDYGTILNVFCKDVRLLLKKFCELPVQAMRGRLSGVSPVHKWWSSVARRRFFGLVNGIPLAAKVSSTHDNNISCLGLMNTSSGSKDVIIAKVLYFEGLANLDSSTDKYWTYVKKWWSNWTIF
ncbi:tudor domain-containing protein 5-like [Arctopsyche grandis]|uniref:tudor domain-containing protein 5-like n=1 Tax=Arctopsyche grandis TaxID=121162 RepID=UPI00406D8069